jgi:hypothetical protein
MKACGCRSPLTERSAGFGVFAHSQPELVFPLHDWDPGAEANADNRGDQTASPAAVAEHYDSAGSRLQQASNSRAKARQLSAAPKQRDRDVAAESEGDVATVRNRDE